MARCINCNIKFKQKYFLQKFCLIDACIDASIKYALNFNSEKEIKKRFTEIKLQNAEGYKEKLQSKVQEITRLIDKDLLCIATQKYAGQIHGGHVYARGGNSYMGFNLHNIHRQSAQSNHHHNDDGLMKEGLSREYGPEYLEFVSDLRRTPKPNLNNLDYVIIYKKALKICSKLVKEGLTYNLKKRIQLRNEINLELGIYSSEYCVYEII